jgi:hypothetical protein
MAETPSMPAKIILAVVGSMRDPISRKARAVPQCDGKIDIKTKSLSYLT